MVHILVDSTSDLPREEAERLGVTVVPLTVRFGEEEFRDGVDLLPAEFFARLALCRDLPTTSQVNSGVFMDTFRNLLAGKNDEIVGLFLTHRLSGTYQSACIARNSFPRHNIYAIDSGTGSFGLWPLVREAVRMRDEGRTGAEIAARIDELKKRVMLRIVLETLKYAQKGGRIPMTAAVVGSLLHVKPILRIQDGKILIEKKVRGNQAAYDFMAKAMDAEWDRSFPPSLSSAQCPDLLASFVRRLRAETGMETYDHHELGTVIGTYSGPGAVGVAYLLRPDLAPGFETT